MKYKIIKSSNIEEDINDMSEQGWIFVCFIPVTSSGLLCKIQILFKHK